MEPFKNVLVVAVILFMTLASENLYSQKKGSKEKNTFVRVFDFEGKKIEKGIVNYTTDSILELRKGKRLVSIPVKEINFLKTKRSKGKSILIGSIIGGTLGALIGMESSKEETETTNDWLFGEREVTTGTSPGTGAAIGGGIGIAGGALTGLGFSLFNKSKTYIINGEKGKWLMFKKEMDNL